jgi:hypothetical protein
VCAAGPDGLHPGVSREAARWGLLQLSARLAAARQILASAAPISTGTEHSSPGAAGLMLDDTLRTVKW